MVISDKTAGEFHKGSAIRQMFEEGLRLKALHGEDQVADLSIGNPTFSPPAALLRSFQVVADKNGPHAYMPNAGYPYVRERIAGDLKKRHYFRDIEGHHITMTTGAAGGLNVVLKTILDPGDEVIVPRPYFVEYGYYIDNHNGKMVLVETRPNCNLDLGAIDTAIGPRTRAVLVNSPNNPSGRVYDRATLEALADLLRLRSHRLKRPILLISDEPYREICFGDQPFVSPASVYENSFMCYSWSKAFNISGERIGYIAINPMMEDEGPMLEGSLAMSNRILGFVNAPAFMQQVIAGALDAEIDIAHYRDKQERLCAALDEGGYIYDRPDGTFYLFPQTPEPEEAFIERAKADLLLVVPGSAFGREGHFRLSFACSDATVDLACKKLIALGTAARNDRTLLLSKPIHLN